MKTLLIAIGASLLLSSCNALQIKSSPAIDSIQPGKDSTWNGLVLHVAKRNGTDIEGIRLVAKGADGKEVTTIADKGSIAPVSTNNSEVRITLHNAITQIGNNKINQSKLELLLLK